jgi:hypothetical protein
VKKKILFLFVFIFLSFVVFQYVNGQGPVTIPNPLGTTNTFKDLLINIANGVGVLIASLGVIMIIFSAILYLTSAGNPEKIQTAKKALIYAIAGIVIGISATAIVEIIEGIINP